MSCKVCNTSKYVSLHFGAAVCAACAAFFRRTVAEGKVFRCQRDQQCNVDQAVRNVCRACRFKKCLSVGMLVADVQPKRDTSSSRLQKRRKTETEIESASVSVQPVQVDVSANHQHAEPPINHRQFREIVPTSVASDHRPGYILDEVIELYHKLLDRRKYIVGDFKSLKNLFYNDGQQPPQTQPLKFSRESTAQLRRKEMALVADFMQSLRPFSNFTPDDKFMLFKQFSLQFHVVDGCYRTYLNDGLRTNCITLSTGELLNLDDTEHFFEKYASKTLDAATLKKLCFSTMLQAMRDLVEPMTTMKMSEREMLAFNLLLLYSSKNAAALGFDQQRALMKARDEVLYDLHDYYCNNNIEEGEIRLGNLILLAPGVLVLSSIFFHVLNRKTADRIDSLTGARVS